MTTTIRAPAAYAAALSASFAIGLGIAISNGAYSVPAAVCIGSALVILGARWFSRIRGKEPDAGDRDFRAVLLFAACGALTLAWVAVNDERLVLYATRGWRVTEASLLALAAIVTTYVSSILSGKAEVKWLRNARFILILSCVLTGGIDAIRSSPHPDVDVWVLEQQGADVLARAQNPYTRVSVQNTAPGHVGPNVPYVYTPLQLFVTLPAKKIAGDVRYAMLLSVLIAGCAMRFLARRTLEDAPSFAEDAPALFYFLTPKLFFVIEQAWTEPISVMFATLAVAAHVGKKPLLAAILFGLLFATKQTMIWVVPIAWFVVGLRPWQAATALATAGATALPFMVSNFHAMKYALFDFQNLLPPRKD
ncbi:MAG: glycosyltransferase 87 family protein, partial [Polyangiaceae bacterium]